jgi:lysozyme
MAPPQNLWGPDVSAHQAPPEESRHVNWPAVAGSGASFAFVKATEGTDYVSRAWTPYAYARKARAAGLVVGGYHFARPGLSGPNAQADHFVRTLGAAATAPGYLPPVLDIERAEGLTGAQLRHWTDRFCRRVKQRTGRAPIVYTYALFFTGPLGRGAGWLRPGVKLWVAHYTNRNHPAVSGWAFWQHTSSARIRGIPGPCDRNVYAHDRAHLRALAGLEGPVPIDPDHGDLEHYPDYRTWYGRWGGRVQSVLYWFHDVRPGERAADEQLRLDLDNALQRIDALEKGTPPP